MTLTWKPPVYTRAEAREWRQRRKARAAWPGNPGLHAAGLTDERRYEHAKAGAR
jgi:hypothetical protein